MNAHIYVHNFHLVDRSEADPKIQQMTRYEQFNFFLPLVECLHEEASTCIIHTHLNFIELIIFTIAKTTVNRNNGMAMGEKFR